MGFSFFSSVYSGCVSVVPVMVGIDGPYTSASSTPTFSPICESAMARFKAVVDFPTPPLALATATIFFTLGRDRILPGLARDGSVCAFTEPERFAPLRTRCVPEAGGVSLVPVALLAVKMTRTSPAPFMPRRTCSISYRSRSAASSSAGVASSASVTFPFS